MSDAVVAAAKTVFADIGVSAVQVEESQAVDSVATDPAASIGFAGSEAAGTLSLLIPWRVLEGTYPCPQGSRDDLLDWLRELSNLLLGGIKAAFLERGIRFEIGCPTSAIAPHSGLDPADGKKIVHVLEVDSQKAVIVFDAIVTPDVKWEAHPKSLDPGVVDDSDFILL